MVVYPHIAGTRVGCWYSVVIKQQFCHLSNLSHYQSVELKALEGGELFLGRTSFGKASPSHVNSFMQLTLQAVQDLLVTGF